MFEDLRSIFNEYKLHNKSVLYYPSSGLIISGLFDLDYDVFILSDFYLKYFFKGKIEKCDRSNRIEKYFPYLVFKVKDKFIILINEDNNLAYNAIYESNIKISCVIGVNDGCMEGGNYECINTKIWLRRLFELFQGEKGLYITDHFIANGENMGGNKTDYLEKNKIEINGYKINQIMDEKIQKKYYDIIKPLFVEKNTIGLYEIE